MASHTHTHTQKNQSRVDPSESDPSKVRILHTKRAQARDTAAEPPVIDLEFELWWKAYPRRIAKGAAARAYRSARKKAEAAVLLQAVKAYAEQKAGSEPQFVKHPATWLNGECWLDEAPPVQEAPPGRYVPPPWPNGCIA